MIYKPFISASIEADSACFSLAFRAIWEKGNWTGIIPVSFSMSSSSISPCYEKNKNHRDCWSRMCEALGSSQGKLSWKTIKIIQKLWRWKKQHVTSVGQRKNLSPQQDSNLWPPKHWTGALSTELRRTHGERGHIRGSYLTCVLHTARISNVETVLYVQKLFISLLKFYLISVLNLLFASFFFW